MDYDVFLSGFICWYFSKLRIAANDYGYIDKTFYEYLNYIWRLIMKEKYPENELITYEKNNNLMLNWSNYISDKNIFDGYSSDDFVKDGFYPHFYSQKYKILYIGAESRGISGCDYIEVLYNAYKENYIGGRHINSKSNQIHDLMFQITYGIKNDFKEFEEIPPASELTSDFGTKSGISFAFMNLSKFSNEKEYFPKDYPLINNFIDVSQNESTNFWNEQIEILNPDIIITMNLSGYLSYLGTINKIYDDFHSIYNINVGQKVIPLIDSKYHFAYWRKNKKTDFYDPLKKIVKKIIATPNA